MKICKRCSCKYEPRPWEILRKDSICRECKRIYQNEWSRKRRASGIPSQQMSREWMQEYHKKYMERAGVRERKAANMRRYNKDPKLRVKHKARWALNKAIHQSKTLTRQPCIRCGSKRSEGHHEDYSKPLVVIWLCRPCHKVEHSGCEGKGSE